MHRLTIVGSCLLAISVLATAPARAAAPVQFASKVNPYSMAYPTAWRHVSGHLSGSFSMFPYDEFYNPRRSHSFNVNVVVARLPLPAAAKMTTLDYLRQSEQDLRNHGDTVRETGTALLAGHRVTLVAYTDTRAHTQAYLVNARGVWVFGLTTAIGDTGRWLTTFRSMLDSVRLR